MDLRINPYLVSLAQQVLLATGNAGLSKVRFAKTLYFVHKGLVQSDRVPAKELAFVRMPLGPVPVQFSRLQASNTGINATSTPTGLAYDAITYRLEEKVEPTELYDDVLRICQMIRPFTTSELVEISHQDPSWINRENSQEYYIADEDLANQLPRKAKKRTEDQDKQQLQAQLLSGMLADIVEESTDLEYPS